MGVKSKTYLPLDHALNLGILPIDQRQQPLVLGLLGLDAVPPPVALGPEAVVLRPPPPLPPLERRLQPLSLRRPSRHLGLEDLLLPLQLGHLPVLLLDDPDVRPQLLRLLVGDDVGKYRRGRRRRS